MTADKSPDLNPSRRAGLVQRGLCAGKTAHNPTKLAKQERGIRMSLGIAVLTEEGVVVAAESLGTLLSQEKAAISSKCKCGQEGKPNLACAKCGQVIGPAPDILRQYPATFTFHCQKLFRINRNSALLIVGNPTLGDMKAQHVIFAFVNWLREKVLDNDYAEQMVVHWQTFCSETNTLGTHKGKTELVLAGIKAKGSPAPFAQQISIADGKVQAAPSISSGIIAIGVHEILDKMFGGDGIRQYPIKDFPLQDAVEFTDFLMQMQIGVDKYTARLPRVGGEIDIAVIHPNHGFAWVRQKDLQRAMESQANQGI